MSQKRINNKDLKITKLAITKEEFRNKLKKRIEIGQNLFDRDLTTKEELDDLIIEYKNWNEYNFELLKQSFNNHSNDYKNNYNKAGFSFIGDEMGTIAGNPILSRKNLIKYKLDSLKRLLDKSELFSSEVENYGNKILNLPANSIIKEKVFIVHGHDDLAKTKVARFIERLGLIPIILHEQTNSGKTIIEKIEEYTDVGFGIVLYTACDVGSLKGEEDKLKNRARQNVVFEHGFLIGKIGRKNVCALVKDEIEIPNDISGVVYEKMDSYDAWFYKVAKELKQSGYNIDMNLV